MRIYLDQNAWIGLLRAHEKHSEGERHRDVLALIEEAVARGWASLPLSSVHYLETARRRPYAKRTRLAHLMLHLSQRHSIAPFATLVRAELRRAVAAWFGSRVVPAAPRPFGVGADHAFATSLIQNFASARGQRAPWVKDLLEWGALAGHPEHDEPGETPVHKIEETMRKEAHRLEQLRELRRPEGWTRGDRSKRMWAAQAYTEAVEELNDAFAEAGVPAGHLMVQGPSGMTRFLNDVPTLHARYELGRLKEQATSAAWTANDMRDIQALSVAVVYADVVVTEKSWTALIGRSGLDRLRDTIVVSDLNDLIDVLVGSNWTA